MPKQYYKASTFRAQMSLGYLLRRAYSLMTDVVEPLLAERGFSFVQYIVLMAVRDGVAVNPKDLCGQLRHDSGALTRVIDQLAERGLLERERRDRDRRKVRLQITTAGREALDGVIPIVVDQLNEALRDFSTEEVHEFKRLIGKLNTRLQANVEAAHAPAAKASV
ncbi:MAG TPA: MarR family winged helix-turn-helix transcriptional regulator [Steroidobacteraceae bacterium]|nr:MarR family winged helix-turn-helix transcriptional regulator [Steroidobacteraceae bacterium]